MNQPLHRSLFCVTGQLRLCVATDEVVIYIYRIRIGAHVLICRDLRDRVVDWLVRVTYGMDSSLPVNKTGGLNQYPKLKI